MPQLSKAPIRRINAPKNGHTTNRNDHPKGADAMQHGLSSASLRKMKPAVEKAWLHYFNQTLFAQGLITEEERNRMLLKIDQRKTSGID